MLQPAQRPPTWVGPASSFGLLVVFAWAYPAQIGLLAQHAPYFLPALVLLLAAWGKVARGFGVHNLFRDDAQIFGPKVKNPRALRILASPALWSGAGFAAVVGYAWIIAWSPAPGACDLPAARPPCGGPPIGSLPAMLVAAAVHLWASDAALRRQLADLSLRDRGARQAELGRVALGLALGFGFCCLARWAADRMVPWEAGLAPHIPGWAPFAPQALIFLLGFVSLAWLFRRVRILPRRSLRALFGVTCAGLILAGLLVLALQAEGGKPRDLWLVSCVFMIPVVLTFVIRNSLPCVSLAALGLGAIALGQTAPLLWSSLRGLVQDALAALPALSDPGGLVAGLLAAAGVMAYLVAVNGQPHRLRLPEFDYRQIVNPQAEKSEQAGGGSPTLTPVAAIEAWSKANGAPPALILIAVSGGAYRATFWSSLVIDRLLSDPRSFPDVARGVQLVTGASGGMVAGAYLAAMRAQNLAGSVTDRIEQDTLDAMTKEGRRFPIKRDSLSAVAHQFAQWDLRDLIVPGRALCDRGVVLERQWGTLNMTFSKLEKAAAVGEAPSVILSPMLVESGAPALFSNLDLEGILNRDANARATAVEIFDVFRGYDRITLATAVRINASFPYVSPAVSLPTRPDRRAVDAGYYDNFGVDLLTDYLDSDKVFQALRPDPNDPHPRKIAVIQIRAFPSDQPTPAPSRLARALQAFTSPLEGVASARRASQIFRNDQSLQATCKRYAQNRQGSFGIFTFEASADVSMSWYTRCDEMAALQDLLKPLGEGERDKLDEFEADTTAGQKKSEEAAADLQADDPEALQIQRLQHRRKIEKELCRLSDFLGGRPPTPRKNPPPRSPCGKQLSDC